MNVLCLLLTASSSLGKAIFSRPRGFWLSSSSSLLTVNFNLAFLLQKSVDGKSSPSRICNHLLNPELLRLLFWSFAFKEIAGYFPIADRLCLPLRPCGAHALLARFVRDKITNSLTRGCFVPSLCEKLLPISSKCQC